jgi:NAD(P)-dependent dehydrogenase (short-subunit alcohol dehydrogenase family)
VLLSARLHEEHTLSASDLTGKSCLITGANSGIGLEASVALAKLGAEVVMVARDAKRGAVALADVQRRSGSGKVSLLLCDFASQQSIRQLAEQFRQQHSKLHILVNNAGAVFPKRLLTADGIESTFAVNHLGYFLLTNLLLDLIVASSPARIVNVASEGHRRGTIDFDDLSFERGYGTMSAYGRSKLANILFTNELARRLEGKHVTVNSLHPGVVATGIWSKAPLLASLLLVPISKLFFISPEQGSRTMVYLASSPEVEGVTGQYFIKNKPVRSSKQTADEALAKRLWDVSAQLSGLH